MIKTKTETKEFYTGKRKICDFCGSLCAWQKDKNDRWYLTGVSQNSRGDDYYIITIDGSAKTHNCNGELRSFYLPINKVWVVHDMDARNEVLGVFQNEQEALGLKTERENSTKRQIWVTSYSLKLKNMTKFGNGLAKK